MHAERLPKSQGSVLTVCPLPFVCCPQLQPFSCDQCGAVDFAITGLPCSACLAELRRQLGRYGADAAAEAAQPENERCFFDAVGWWVSELIIYIWYSVQKAQET